MMSWYLAGLIALLLLAMVLVAWGAYTLGDLPESRPAPKHERRPQHAHWTTQEPTRKVKRRTDLNP